MQNLYAFSQCKSSAYHLALEMIENNFTPQWDTEETEIPVMKEEKTIALKLFRENFEKGEFVSESHVPERVRETISDAFDFYLNQVRKDAEFHKKNMIKETERLFDLYLWILLLLIEIAEFVNIEQKEKEKKFSQLKKTYVKSNTELNLYHNKLIKALKENGQLQNAIAERKITWANHKDKIRNWYRDIVKKTEIYNQYIQKTNPGFEEDQIMVSQIVKHVIFKNEVIGAFMEEQDLFWQENKAILKSMVMKTIKSVSEQQNSLEMATLSNNWDDDKDYFVSLYELTVKHEKEHAKTLANKIKKWDIDRIATLDYILLQMAISEMINFPSIPVKVTINEFIEISKLYSTPKSKQFINGILDVVANELMEEGVIRKSGRGLIDNK